jgi:5-methylcytosine-specific restriction endonuclease McrA
MSSLARVLTRRGRSTVPTAVPAPPESNRELADRGRRLVAERGIEPGGIYRVRGQAQPHLIDHIDGFACAECQATTALEVHHLTPLSEGSSDQLDNLLTLCERCHKAVTRA